MDMTISVTPKHKSEKKWTLLNVKPVQLERFKKIADHYNYSMVDLFDKVLDALEADMAGRKAEEA